MFQDLRMGNLSMQVATALLEEERRRSIQIAALEWKLRETRRRHVEEMAHYAAIDLSGIPGMACATARRVGSHVDAHKGASSGTWPVFPPTKVAAGSPFEAVRARVVQATPREPSAGPCLATTRRHIRGRRVQLWVEDRLASHTARIHAMDEDGSWRIHRDVPDHTLSGIFEDFRHCRGRPLALDDQVDVEDFLHALLDGVDLVEAPSGGDGLELGLPHHFDSPHLAQATPKWTGGGAGSIGKRDQDPTTSGAGSTSSCFGGQLLLLPDQPRGCTGPSLLSPAETQSPPSKWPVQTASAAPCLLWGGPGHGPSEESAGFRADGYLVNLTRNAEGRGDLAATDPWHAGQSSRARMCISQVATSTRSSHCRGLVRPQSAPNRAKRPQIGHRLCRDRDRNVRVASPVPSESPRVSSSGRVRPTSAKALKHRRSEDDGNDCIIYEDIEGKNEEFEPGENHLANMEAGKRSSTGGCGSSSSLHGFLSCRLHSRQPSVYTCGRISSRPSSATSCGTLVLDESMKIFPDEADESLCGAVAPSEPEAERPHDVADLPPAAATAAAEAGVEAEASFRAGAVTEGDERRAFVPPTEVASPTVASHREAIWVRGTRVAAGSKGAQSMMASVRLIPRAPPMRNQLQRPNNARRSHGYSGTQLKTQFSLQTCTDEASKETQETEQLLIGASTATVMAAPQVSGEAEEALCIDVMAVQASNQEEQTSRPEPEEELTEGGFTCPAEILQLGSGPRASSPPPRMTSRFWLS